MLPVTQIVTNFLWRRSRRRTLSEAPARAATENLFTLQPLEKRILFNTTFAVSVSGQPKATLGSDYAVNRRRSSIATDRVGSAKRTSCAAGTSPRIRRMRRRSTCWP